MSAESLAIAALQDDPLVGVLQSYATAAKASDIMLGASPDMAEQWTSLLAALSSPGKGGLSGLQDRAARQVIDLGMAFRLVGEAEERPWPLSPVPLLISGEDWTKIEQGLSQRADLLELVLSDIYGPKQLVSEGNLPAAAVAGSSDYWRKMEGITPGRGRYLRFYAADLGRGPRGEWRVLSDHVRAPTGAGYALENRLAMTRSTGDLQGQMNVRRLAPFFASFRQGLAACCERYDPRIALLTPGRFNQSYPEQAHLARYLGLLLVEGEDLTVKDNKLYVRTIEGIKRIDAIWRRLDTKLLDPLAYDSGSKIGVPDLFEAIASGGLVMANWPGVGVVESPAFSAFMPRLAQVLLKDELLLPNIATWWCGQPREHDVVKARLNTMAIGSAFGQPLPLLAGGRARMVASLDDTERRTLLDAMDRRPMDYVGQELVQLSTTPALIDGEMVPRPFTLRVFLARDADDNWQVMPGGFARLSANDDMRAVLVGEGDMSADVCIVSDKTQPVISLLDSSPSPAIRRVAGTLPSKVADNLFWMSRYLERAEMTLRLVRSLIGGTIEADSASVLRQDTLARVADMLSDWGAATPESIEEDGVTALCRTAIGDHSCSGSVHALLASAESIARGCRERLAAEFWRLISRPLVPIESWKAEVLLEHASELHDRLSALSGLAAENMVRGHGWIFHDIGRRLERAIHITRQVKVFAGDAANSDDLGVLLDLCDCQISYRVRYPSGMSLMPVRDMLVLEPNNPRALVFQVDLIVSHLAALPKLRDDGMPEPPARLAASIAATLAAASAETLTPELLETLESKLLELSNTIGNRFFLQGREASRATGMTRLA
jgi:uncharacterized circularly permuted ATP-grasp superfamily protein/uncharacterized alpha-E superfamily protein